MSNPKIGILLGSKSDLPQLENAQKLLSEMGVPFEVRIMSAHRTPERAGEYARTARDRGIKVLIGMAGVAAHLAGALAAHSDLPVLGIPMDNPPLGGLDALLSTVQMPGGVPVGTLAIGAAGAKNAGLLAARMLAATRPDLRTKLDTFQSEQAQRVRSQELS